MVNPSLRTKKTERIEHHELEASSLNPPPKTPFFALKFSLSPNEKTCFRSIAKLKHVLAFHANEVLNTRM